jgi:hypothetical protein
LAVGAFQDRRFRLQVASQLWSACSGIIGPKQVTEIADSVDEEIGGHQGGDGLELIRAKIRSRGYQGADVHRIAVLVSMVLIDRVNAEIASIRAKHRDGA